MVLITPLKYCLFFVAQGLEKKGFWWKREKIYGISDKHKRAKTIFCLPLWRKKNGNFKIGEKNKIYVSSIMAIIMGILEVFMHSVMTVSMSKIPFWYYYIPLVSSLVLFLWLYKIMLWLLCHSKPGPASLVDKAVAS